MRSALYRIEMDHHPRFEFVRRLLPNASEDELQDAERHMARFLDTLWSVAKRRAEESDSTGAGAAPHTFANPHQPP